MAFSFFRSRFNFYGDDDTADDENSGQSSSQVEEDFEKVGAPEDTNPTTSTVRAGTPTKLVDPINITLLLEEINQLKQQIQSQDQKLVNLHQKLDLKEHNLSAQDKKIKMLLDEKAAEKAKKVVDDYELRRLRMEKIENQNSLNQFIKQMEANQGTKIIVFGGECKEKMENEIAELKRIVDELESRLRNNKVPMSPGAAREQLEIENTVLQLQISEQNLEIKRLKAYIEDMEAKNWCTTHPGTPWNLLEQYIDSKVLKDQIKMIIDESEMKKAQDASKHEELEEKIKKLEKELEMVKVEVL